LFVCLFVAIVIVMKSSLRFVSKLSKELKRYK